MKGPAATALGKCLSDERHYETAGAGWASQGLRLKTRKSGRVPRPSIPPIFIVPSDFLVPLDIYSTYCYWGGLKSSDSESTCINKTSYLQKEEIYLCHQDTKARFLIQFNVVFAVALGIHSALYRNTSLLSPL